MSELYQILDAGDWLINNAVESAIKRNGDLWESDLAEFDSRHGPKGFMYFNNNEGALYIHTKLGRVWLPSNMSLDQLQAARNAQQGSPLLDLQHRQFQAAQNAQQGPLSNLGAAVGSSLAGLGSLLSR